MNAHYGDTRGVEILGLKKQTGIPAPLPNQVNHVSLKPALPALGQVNLSKAIGVKTNSAGMQATESADIPDEVREVHGLQTAVLISRTAGESEQQPNSAEPGQDPQSLGALFMLTKTYPPIYFKFAKDLNKVSLSKRVPAAEQTALPREDKRASKKLKTS